MFLTEQRNRRGGILIGVNDNLKHISIKVSCRSLSANLKEINTCLHSLSQNFDIIAFSETWFSSNDNLNIFSLPGYQFCHMDRENQRGGGVAFYVKSCIEFDVMESII